MKEHGLMVPRTIYKAKRTAGKNKPRANKPNEFWGIDATKFIVNGLGWVYLVIVLDWYTKKVVGWRVSLRNRSKEWKEALDMAVNVEFPEGVRGKGLKLVSDNGSQPTSISFMRDMSTLCTCTAPWGIGARKSSRLCMNAKNSACPRLGTRKRYENSTLL